MADILNIKISEGLIPPPVSIDNSNKVYSVAASCISLGVIAALTVILRLGIRFRLGIVRADDHVIVLATVLYIGWTAMAAYINLNAGVGKPLWEITVAEFSIWYKGMLGYIILYPTISGLIRVSILLNYVRFFAGRGRHTRYMLWILMTLQVVTIVVFCVLPAIICKPMTMFWELEREPYCNDPLYNHIQIALHSISCALDFILLVFPMYPIFRLPMTTQQRIGVAIMFILGAAASIVATYKLGHVVHIFGNHHDRPLNSKWESYAMHDYIPIEWECYGTALWIPSQLELAVALIGTSLPALRQLLLKDSRLIPSPQNGLYNIRSTEYFRGRGRELGMEPTMGEGGYVCIDDGDVLSRAVIRDSRSSGPALLM